MYRKLLSSKEFALFFSLSQTSCKLCQRLSVGEVTCSLSDSLDWQWVEMRLTYLKNCKHRHRHLHLSNEPKMAPDGVFDGLHLVTRSVPTSITHVHSIPMSPYYTTVQSIELIVQTGSRERKFTAQNASNSAECRKMRYLANIFSVTRPRPGFNHFKRLVWCIDELMCS